MTTHAVAAPPLLFLTRSDVVHVGGESPDLYVEAVEEALALHASGLSELPLKVYLRWPHEVAHVSDRIIAMPAYLGGERPVAGLKWVASKHDNPTRRGLERASALIVLNEVETNYPIAVMEGALISAMRTAAVSAVAARHLGRRGFRRFGCIGCGFVGQAHVLTIGEVFPEVASVLLYDLDRARAEQLAGQCRELLPHLELEVASSAREVVEGADVVVACTIAEEPYVEAEWLRPGHLLVNVSLMDVTKDAFLAFDKIVVDDWEQCNREGKVINELYLEGRLDRSGIHAELGEIVLGRRPGRESDDERILVNPMGLAIEDIGSARRVYERAVEQDVGTWLRLE